MQAFSRIALLVLALAGLAFLYTHSQVRGGDGYDAALESFRRLSELEGRLDTAVLEARTGLTLDYDALDETLRAMERVGAELATIPEIQGDRELAALVSESAAHVANKRALVLGFESSSSLLRNSVTYLPQAALAVSRAAGPDSASRTGSDVTAFLADVFVCGHDCNPQALAQVQADIATLRNAGPSLRPDERRALDVFLRHAELFARVAPAVDVAVRALVEDRSVTYEGGYRAVRDRRDAAIARANLFRIGLVLLSVALAVAVAAMVLRLRRKAKALRAALGDVERERLSVEEKRRELAALNQHLEMRVDARTSELSASREQYRALLETTQAIPWEMASESLRFTYVGPQVVRLLGYPAADWITEGFFGEHLHPERAAQTIATLDSFDVAGAQGELELRVDSADGRERWFRGFVQTGLDSAARRVRRGIFVDVTERRILETELRASQKLESIGRLAAGVAHEINTPVQFVADNVHFVGTAFADLAGLVKTFRAAVRKDATDEERLRLAAIARDADEAADTDYVVENIPPAIESARQGLERIATIVRSLKDFAHPDRKSKSAVDLNAIVSSALTMASNETKHVADVQSDLGPIPLVTCHGGEIAQVILNLIVNAAHTIGDVMAETQRRGVIDVRTWQEEADVLISVRDSGAGIPIAIRDNVFDPFFTTKEVGRGTGQGLAIARSIVVEKHGGALTFETELNHGTAFVIRLPIGQATAGTEIAA